MKTKIKIGGIGGTKVKVTVIKTRKRVFSKQAEFL